jgi:exopolysaccharide biosynthesis polyprenyl glycosylphosphotransferase
MKNLNVINKELLNLSRNVVLDLRAPERIQIRRGTWKLRLLTLVLVDSLLLSLAWFLSKFNARFIVPVEDISKINANIPILIFIQIAALAVQGTYCFGKDRYNYFRIITTLAFAHGLILVFDFFNEEILYISRYGFILSYLISTSLVCAGRFAIDTLLKHLRQKQILGRNFAFVICDSEEYEQAINLVEKEKRYIISGSASASSLDRANRQETLNDINKLGITEVFITWSAIKNRMFISWLFQTLGISVHILPMNLKPIDRNVRFQKIGGIVCLSFDVPVITGTDFWIKKIFDFSATTLLLLFFFPIYIAIAIAIKLDSPGPVFYRQTRIGLHGKEFKVWKFRTMRTDADKLQKELEVLNETKDGILFKIKNDPRVTRVGKFLRRYSLDELPQLFNVLLGEMSLVGPRPLPTRDVDKFSEYHFIRQEVLPGVTGLWQVSGRSDILDFDRVIQLDLNYIENWSLKLDFEILLKTVKVIVNKEGAY